ncbi:hypothetical protein LXT21_24635 [Myxococcus sp. K38C18041901]|uniref:hypothetical protein n=1 Tax=Myxococcus guangdongensis TaxID=2906760 RepID=UPI0020A7B1F1|nr:hypothetical protein [Myxococcus guangdongensis]MCP3061975.1 hypothetical protein [Myxococcus guangdongensis]
MASWTWKVLGLVLLLSGSGARAFNDADALKVVGFARTQLRKSASAMPNETRSPKAPRADGTWTTVANTDEVAWTQGFFPGGLWQLYQVGLEPSWQSKADRWTRALEVQKTNRRTHDLGFSRLGAVGVESAGDWCWKSGVVRCCTPGWRSGAFSEPSGATACPRLGFRARSAQ